jgi:hypothetical protein
LRAAQQESARNLIQMGGAEFLREWTSMKADRPDAVEPVAAAAPDDILGGYDLGIVLASGVVKPAEGFIADLCEHDAEFLGRAILELTQPARTEEQEKNVVVPFTSA